MSANEAMAAYWTDQAGPEWVRNEQFFDHMLEPFGLAVLDALHPTPGESVLDVGCGYGTTSIAAARRVGRGGRVVGIDISPPMIERARERVRALAFDQVSFVVGDAQTHQLDRPVDTVVSRFGVMFFSDPTAAFANLHAVVRPGGRLAVVCWREPSLNPWMLAPIDAWRPYLADAPPPPVVGAPGPFGFADDARVAEVLDRAGWRNVQIVEHRGEARLGAGRGVEGALEQTMASSTARALRDQLEPGRRDAALADLRAALAAHVQGDDVVYPASAWIVTAER